MDSYIKLLSKYVEDINNVLETPLEATNFKTETSIQQWGKYLELLIDFEWELQDESLYDDYNNFTWINFLYKKKINDFKTFVKKLKNDNFAVFHNVIENEEPYYDDYPHLMFALPYKSKIRFIMIGCRDFATLEGEHLLCDILVDKNNVLSEFDRLIKEIKDIVTKEQTCEN